MADRSARIATVLEGAHWRRQHRLPEDQRSSAPAAWDRLAHSRSATLPATRRRLQRDAEIVGGKISWRPSIDRRLARRTVFGRRASPPASATRLHGCRYARIVLSFDMAIS